jgi:integrase
VTVPSGQRRAAKIADGCFAAVIRAFMAPDNPKWNKYADATRDLWGRELRLAERPDTLGAYSIYEIRPSLVQAYLDGLADWPAKQEAALSALRRLEKWAIVRDLLPHPITLGCEVEGSDGGHIPWNDEQVLIAETNARADIARVITLGANTGQRGSDLVKMRWTDIEDYKGRPGVNVIQKKTKKEVWVPFTQPLMTAMTTWERRPGFILLNERGQPWTRRNLSHVWGYERDTNPLLAPLKEAGLVLHGLRGTACVRLLRAGANTRQVSDVVGMSEAMVARYTRFSEQKENATAAVLHLDRTARELGGTDRLKRGG